MGKYSDFDLDLNQVKKAENSTISPQSTIVTTISALGFPGCSGTSCECSMSDMTLCGAAAGGKVELLRC